MGVYNATVITNAGQNLIAAAIAGGQAINFTAVKTSTHVYPAGTALLNLTSLSDVKQTVAPTSVDVYNNNVVQISARVPNTGIATAYLINTIGLFGSAGGAETLIAVLTAQTPDEVPVFDAEAPAAFIFNIQMTIQNADEVVFEVNDTGTATVADLNRVAQPFTGATASAAGSVGRVPAPAAGANKKFLCGDGTWTAPADMVEDFTSSDVADGSATAWTGVNPLTSGETNKSIFAKLSQMFKNIRFLYKLLGTTDISNIGNGTVTNALSVLNAKTGGLLEPTIGKNVRISLNPDSVGWAGIMADKDSDRLFGLLQINDDGRMQILHMNDGTSLSGLEINPQYPIFVAREFSRSYTVNANTAWSGNISITPPNGLYKPVGIIGYNLTHNRVTAYTLKLVSDTNVFAQIQNTTSSAITSTIAANVLFEYVGDSKFSIELR